MSEKIILIFTAVAITFFSINVAQSAFSAKKTPVSLSAAIVPFQY